MFFSVLPLPAGRGIGPFLLSGCKRQQKSKPPYFPAATDFIHPADAYFTALFRDLKASAWSAR